MPRAYLSQYLTDRHLSAWPSSWWACEPCRPGWSTRQRPDAPAWQWVGVAIDGTVLAVLLWACWPSAQTLGAYLARTTRPVRMRPYKPTAQLLRRCVMLRKILLGSGIVSSL